MRVGLALGMALLLLLRAVPVEAAPKKGTILTLVLSEDNGEATADFFVFSIQSSRRCDARRPVTLYVPDGTERTGETEQGTGPGGIKQEGVGGERIGFPNPPPGDYFGVVHRSVVGEGSRRRVCLASYDWHRVEP